MITWKQRIQAIRDSGFTLQQIADHCDMPLSTLGDLATGRSTAPRGESAIRIDALYRERCGNPKQSRVA